MPSSPSQGRRPGLHPTLWTRQGLALLEDVANASDLRPRDLRVCSGDLRGKLIQGLADCLQIPLHRILHHLRDARIRLERDDVTRPSTARWLPNLATGTGVTAWLSSSESPE